MLAARVLLLIAALMQAYDGLSSVLLPALGDASRGPFLRGWMIATGALQSVAAALALTHAGRRKLRDATFAVAASILLGWLTTVPAVVRHGLDFYGDGRLESGYFVLSPIIALAGATLTWRGAHPLLGAYIVTAPTIIGLLFIAAFAISIARFGF